MHIVRRCRPALAAGLGLLFACPSQVVHAAPAGLESGARFAVTTRSSANSYYAGNRAPLLPSPFMKLPIGSIRPAGWLRTQLQDMADGFVGHLPEVSSFVQFEGSAWANPKGEGKNGWEELPYWLKGYGDLGYVLQDKRITDEARRWIDAILASQRPDGYFGPESNRHPVDLWPNMLALYALRSFYEATADPRVLPFMTRYFKWQMSLPLEEFLPGSWQRVRGGDNLDSIYWLYNRTGEPWLLDLARVTHERTDDWAGRIASWHGVNAGQGFREPAQYYMQVGDARYLNAALRNYDTIKDSYGQVPGGLWGADENARPGYTGPRQGSETCTMVESMFSDELLTTITGDPVWADRCEEIAFDSLPAAVTPEFTGLHYLTAPNMVQLDRQSKAPMLQNGGDMLSYNPRDFRCCQHNVAMGWPYFTEHLWMATPGNGLAAVLYAPNAVTAKVGDGTPVQISETTDYPFDETIRLQMTMPKSMRFPLELRVPGWCQGPRVSVNGQNVITTQPRAGWLAVDRRWQSGDVVLLDLPMTIQVKTWPKNKNGVSVSRGPLTYSLKIGERWQKYGADKWPGYEVFPTTPWNYGLVLDAQNPAASFQVEKHAVATQPFTVDNAPITLKAKGKRIPGWKLEPNGLIGELQKSPVRSDEPVEDITLVPMGCARLRVSLFPRLGDGPDASDWGQNAVTASASHVNDSLAALNDDELPKNSADQSVARFTWWDHQGTTEWVQYDFLKPHRLGAAEVYWYDDQPTGGQCRVPASWYLQWWDGTAWQPVNATTPYGTAKDQLNRVTFAPVETTKVRIQAQLKPNASAGILEWRVGEK